MEINLFKKIKTNCLTNNDINTQMFLNNLYCLKSVKSNNIIFNFENIDVCTSNFCSTFIRQLINIFDKDFLNNNMKFINTNDVIKALLKYYIKKENKKENKNEVFTNNK